MRIINHKDRIKDATVEIYCDECRKLIEVDKLQEAGQIGLSVGYKTTMDCKTLSNDELDFCSSDCFTSYIKRRIDNELTNDACLFIHINKDKKNN